MADEQEKVPSNTPQESEQQSQEELERKAKEAIAKLTPREIKKLRAAYFTVRRASVVVCEHKYIPNDFPRHRNCESCWFAFYNDHGNLVKEMDKVFQEYGKEALNNLVGSKQATMFLRFMSTVARMTKEATPVAPQIGESDGEPTRLASGTIDEAGQVPATSGGSGVAEQEVQDQSIAD